jgi:class 3 adenylate cyclase
MGPSEDEADDEILDEVLDHHLGFVAVAPREQVRRLLSLLVGRRPETSLENEAKALLGLLGVDPDDAQEVEHELEMLLEQARAAGIDAELAPPVTQAYIRAVGRIVDAEAESIREILRTVPAEEHAERLDRVLAALLPATARAFELLHSILLRPALAEALSVERLTEPPTAPVAIALVDLTGSTRHLATSAPSAAEDMVDALFEAGQAATLNRPVRAIKYVGDGVFLAGADPSTVALSAFDALDHVQQALPLSARAGLAHGPLLRRAGDYFGLPVNLAQLLTKAASPGTLLATESAAAGLPPALLGRRRRIRVRGVERRLKVVTVLRPER